MRYTTPVKLFFAFFIVFVPHLSFAQTLVKDINIGFVGSEPSHFVRMGDLTYFVANDAIHGYELWVTDGTEQGTVMVKDITGNVADACRYISLHGIKTSNLLVLGKSLFFFANDQDHGFELWRSDGSEGGTYMVKDIFPGKVSSCVDLNLVKAGNYLYFAGNDGNHGTELWKTDGTDSGTVMLKDLNPGIKDGNPQYFFVDSNIVYFSGNDGISGYGLWKTDGTEAGTVYLKNAGPVLNGHDTIAFAKLKGDIFYTGYTIENGAELWKTDGTPAGTIMVKDIVEGKEGSFPTSLTSFKDHIIFSATTGKCGYELWQSDGTAAGTFMIKDICKGAGSSNPNSFAGLKDKVYFVAKDSLRAELWVSDLSDTGTHLFRELDTLATASSEPQNLYVAGYELYYTANNGDRGFELWKTDGTLTGTKMLREICVGSCSSGPGNFFLSDTVLFFSANDEAHGRELYRLGFNSSLLQQITDENHTGVYVDPLRRQLTKMSQTGSDIQYIKIFDLNGNELMTQNIKDPIPLSVDSFSQGLYVLRAYDKYDRVVGFARFVKE
ncbi:MAG: hypothetical protein JWO06_601 [Bacteroidota bacterium]|nr:hypothetical protein [Bacteroidota bacterium]